MAGSDVQRKGEIHVGREDVTRCACLRFEKDMNLIRANTRIRNRPSGGFGSYKSNQSSTKDCIHSEIQL
jgi:hypothetical protein